MSKNNFKKKNDVLPYYAFAAAWLLCACILPLYRIWAILLCFALSGLTTYLVSRRRGKEDGSPDEQQKSQGTKASEPKKSYGPEIDPILEEGERALREMARIYSSVQDKDVRVKINELMRITDKITQDAVADPSDIPQIKKFMNYYLPTTIKLLNAYDRMSSQGIEGENLDRSMNNINEMLDQAIVAYKKRLDSLFENQALDIETDIEVMNRMLAREGLSGEKDFDI